MNILLVVPWDQESGGVASVVGNLAKQLESRGHQIFFLHPDRKAIRATGGKTQWGFRDLKLRMPMPFSPNHPVLSTLGFVALFPLTMLQLLRFIRRHNIQVVNVHYPLAPFVYFALCRALLPIRLVSSIHGADIFPKGLPRTSYPAGMKWLLRGSDLIVANSASFRDDFLRLFPQLRKKTIFIHNGVDLSELTPKPEPARKKGRYLLCVAEHNEKKGLDVLIHAFAIIAESDADLQLLLAGDGPLRKCLEDLSGSLGLQDRIKFLGSQPRPQIAKLLRGCEVFVLPSRSEPFGIVLLEALASRTPVIATNVGGIREIIKSGENGLLVEPENPRELADAVLAVLGDACLQKRVVESGYAVVERRFRCENNATAYERAFEQLRAAAAKPAWESLGSR